MFIEYLKQRGEAEGFPLWFARCDTGEARGYIIYGWSLRAVPKKLQNMILENF